MKFSKLIKNGNKKQEMKLKRNAALLTGLYSAKSPVVVNNYFTPSKQQTFVSEVDRTIVPATPSYEQRYNINTIASYKKTPVFRTSPLSKLFEFKSSGKDAVDSAIAKQKFIECLLETPAGGKMATPRYTKSGLKPKRLQRKETVVRQRTDVNMMTPVLKPQTFNKRQSTKSLFSILTSSSSSSSPETPSTKTSMVTKIKKFVSKSALKVINNSSDRKSLGSNCSSTSLSSCESDDSFCNRSMEQKRINLNLEKIIDADDKRHQTAKPTGWAYQSVQKTEKVMNADEKCVTKVPAMGVTSMMLKNLRRTNPKATIENFEQEPHVFGAALDQEVKVEEKKSEIIQEATYDHLEHVNYSQVKTMVQKFQKNKSCVVVKKHSPNMTRISLYKKKQLSAVNMNESQQYDSIIF